MIWSTSKANLIGRSTSQTSMDIDNCDIGNLEKLSLPNGKGSTMVKSFESMVKRKAKSGQSSVPFPKSPYVSFAKRRYIDCEAAQFT